MVFAYRVARSTAYRNDLHFANYRFQSILKRNASDRDSSRTLSGKHKMAYFSTFSVINPKNFYAEIPVFLRNKNPFYW